MKFQNDMTFLKIVPLVLNSEGGYSNNPKDSGGPTNRGVAWNYNADYLKEHFGMHGPEDIKHLTADQAKQLYYDKYWLASGGGDITDVDLGYIHFDTAVNCGIGAATKMLGSLSTNPRFFDFSAGKNRTIALQLFIEYISKRISYYTHCKARDEFLEGWMNRIVQVIQNAKNLE